MEQYLGPDSYSYVFDGQWGSLDHALGSDSLDDQVSGAAPWWVNSDEPSALDYNTNFKSPAQVASLFAPDQFRNSDHDPVLVGLDLVGPNRGSVNGAGFVAGPHRSRAAFLLTASVDPDSGVIAGAFGFVDARAGLVVAAGRADSVSSNDATITVRGGARVNGRAGYSYEVIAKDGGRRDMLRVRVFNRSGAQIYDNGSRRVVGTLVVREQA